MPPQTNNSNKPKKHRFLRRFLPTLIVLALAGGVVSQRQAIQDEWQLYGYTAPAAVADLATQDGMTSYARKIYYVNHPNIISASSFGQYCPNNGGEKTIILGCYHSGQAGIVLLSVTEPLLNGVEQVTAAHEMLHAAYDRLNSGEKAKIDALLQDYYKNDLHDSRLLAIIDAYKLSEPNDVVNEMHSVFGSEVANLPQPLEQYYKKYFNDRAQVTAFAAKYQAEFTSRQTQVARDDAQLATLKTQIDSIEADLKTKIDTINSQQANLLSLRSTDVNAYNAGVPGYNQLVDSYNREVKNLQNLVVQYNQLVASRNAVALEENQLAKELTSSATQITK